MVQVHKSALLKVPALLFLALIDCSPGGVPLPAHPTEVACRPFWACVVAGDPKPKLLLTERTGKSLGIAFGPSVLDRYEVADKDTVLRAEVHQWRTTLVSGFRSGFSGVFEIVPVGARSNYVLEIDRATVSLSSLEVGFMAQVLSARADLRYVARLVDARGRVVRATSGTAASRTFLLRGRDVTDGVMTAVTAMYEAIGRDCFAPFERLPQ